MYHLKDLHDNGDLLTKIKLLIYDLLYFGNNKSSKERLESFYSNTLLPTVYFTETEVNFLLKFASSTGQTFAQVSKEFQKNKNVICSSHELAPMMMQFFGVEKGFKNGKTFKTALRIFEKEWRRRRV